MPNHYATLGLHHDCSAAQIRAAYRLLAKAHHPDRHAGSAEAVAQTQRLNAAYEVLSDVEARRAYDAALGVSTTVESPAAGVRAARLEQEVFLRIEELLRGTTLEVRVVDPVLPGVGETYPLEIPPGTAVGARFRWRREGGGEVQVRVKLRPDFRFKTRGADLRCDLKISPQRAAQGGVELVRGALGGMLRVTIPARVARDAVVRLPGEGLPKPRGGRGDLLVRIRYRPEVKIRRVSGRG